LKNGRGTKKINAFYERNCAGIKVHPSVDVQSTSLASKVVLSDLEASKRDGRLPILVHEKFINDLKLTIAFANNISERDYKKLDEFPCTSRRDIRIYSCSISKDRYFAVAIEFNRTNNYNLYLSDVRSDTSNYKFLQYRIPFEFFMDVVHYVNMFRFSWKGRLSLSQYYCYDDIDLLEVFSGLSTIFHSSAIIKIDSGRIFVVNTSTPARGKYSYVSYLPEPYKECHARIEHNYKFFGILLYFYGFENPIPFFYRPLISACKENWKIGYSLLGNCACKKHFAFAKFHQYDVYVHKYVRAIHDADRDIMTLTECEVRRDNFDFYLILDSMINIFVLPILPEMKRKLENMVLKIKRNSGGHTAIRFVITCINKVVLAQEQLDPLEVAGLILTIIESAGSNGSGDMNYCGHTWMELVEDKFPDYKEWHFESQLIKMEIGRDVFHDHIYQGFLLFPDQFGMFVEND